jgi:hypothetical protein
MSMIKNNVYRCDLKITFKDMLKRYGIMLLFKVID